MKHSKIKGMRKRRKKRNVVHFLVLKEYHRYPTELSPKYQLAAACMTVKQYFETTGYVRTSVFREEITCKKCKRNPRFLIHYYERRFLGKTI
jgi:hypothetical protein